MGLHINNELRDLISNYTIQKIYPVGAIYLSVNSTNPKDIFGFGTWELDCGNYLIGVDPNTTMAHNKANKHIGDWYTHETVLTVDQMPSHSHTLTKHFPYGIPYNNTSGASANNGGNVFYGESYNPFTIEYSGGNKGHNHYCIPPGFVVYIWKRVA